MKKRKIILKPKGLMMDLHSFLANRGVMDYEKYFHILNDRSKKKFIFRKRLLAPDENDFAVIELNKHFCKALGFYYPFQYTFAMPGEYPTDYTYAPNKPIMSNQEWAITVYSNEYVDIGPAYIKEKDNQILTLPKEHYTKEGYPLRTLNQFGNTHDYQFEFLQSKNKLKLRTGDKKVIILSATLRDILGFDRTHYFNETVEASKSLI